ncbi:hypothetical protein BDP27DRAFT_1369505 [Rhodocollybia butyracea]|uniref:Uncharacterized protein n=1 Tax=Rhodocollybia butyracea TaxID=206335 RepID=A0A9P5U1I2_9AGAR|nr:hypothetical protein BDP27DRAFT_1369505 [Rhodocollybia butyracea]
MALPLWRLRSARVLGFALKPLPACWLGLCNVFKGNTLADNVLKWRQQEDKYFNSDQWANRPLFRNLTTHVQGFGDICLPALGADGIPSEHEPLNKRKNSDI